MQLPAALDLIRQGLSRLTALYGQPVFDEWCVVGAGGAPGGVLAYDGPRSHDFREHFGHDARQLCDEVAGQVHVPGDFHFTLDAHGTRFDALLAIGPGLFLVCNHTQRSVDELRAHPAWRRAQVAWVQLSERFRSQPVEV